tara:strand:- start:657 stop:878 length:222 start_codon:yes stop_codon:yes gene_type:complete
MMNNKLRDLVIQLYDTMYDEGGSRRSGSVFRIRRPFNTLKDLKKAHRLSVEITDVLGANVAGWPDEGTPGREP